MSRLGVVFRCLVTAASLALVACGGGGSSSSSGVASTSGSGSGSSGGTTVPSTTCPTTREMNTAGTASSAAIYMDTCTMSSSAQTANIPYVSVYLCAPGSTTNCAWIDHIQVDTGSTGLRVLASAIPTAVLAGLSPVTYSGQNIGECYNFVLSYFWGGLRRADIGLGGTAAPNSSAAFNGTTKALDTVIHVLNDSNLPATAPTSCTSNSTGGSETTAATIGANGVMGIGLFADDCNGIANCAYGSQSNPGIYYLCATTSTTSCSGFSPTLPSQIVPNPIAAAQLPGSSLTLKTGQSIAAAAISYPLSGGLTNYSSVAGTLNFGVPAVGTSGGPGSILLADVNSGLLSGSVNGFNYPSYDSTVLTNAQDNLGLYAFGVFIDSGSNAIFYYDQNTDPSGASPLSSTGTPLSLAVTCATGTAAANSGFQCISTGTSLSVTVQMSNVGTSPTTGSVTLSSATNPQLAPVILYDANYLFNTPSLQNGPAFAGLVSAPNKAFANEFDLGIPAFFGRTLWFGIANASVANTSNAPSTVPYYGI